MLIMLYLGRRRPVVGQCPNLALDPSLCLHLPLLRVENTQPFLACDLSDTNLAVCFHVPKSIRAQYHLSHFSGPG